LRVQAFGLYQAAQWQSVCLRSVSHRPHPRGRRRGREIGPHQHDRVRVPRRERVVDRQRAAGHAREALAHVWRVRGAWSRAGVVAADGRAVQAVVWRDAGIVHELAVRAVASLIEDELRLGPWTALPTATHREARAKAFRSVRRSDRVVPITAANDEVPHG
jgi:hypothetical protein